MLDGAAHPLVPGPRALRGAQVAVAIACRGVSCPWGGVAGIYMAIPPPTGATVDVVTAARGGGVPPTAPLAAFLFFIDAPTGGAAAAGGPGGTCTRRFGPLWVVRTTRITFAEGGSPPHRVWLVVERSGGTPTEARRVLAQDRQTLWSAFWGALGGLYGVTGALGGQDDAHRAPGAAPPPPSVSAELCFLRLGGPCMPCRGGIGPCGSALGGWFTSTGTL